MKGTTMSATTYHVQFVTGDKTRIEAENFNHDEGWIYFTVGSDTRLAVQAERVLYIKEIAEQGNSTSGGSGTTITLDANVSADSGRHIMACLNRYARSSGLSVKDLFDLS